MMTKYIYIYCDNSKGNNRRMYILNQFRNEYFAFVIKPNYLKIDSDNSTDLNPVFAPH